MGIGGLSQCEKLSKCKVANEHRRMLCLRFLSYFQIINQLNKLKMETYRITVKNNISGKKRFFNVSAISFERAIEQGSHLVHHSSEDIIKAVLFS